MMHPIADEFISLIGSDRISDKLRFWIFRIFQPFILLYQKKVVVLVTNANIRLS